MDKITTNREILPGDKEMKKAGCQGYGIHMIFNLKPSLSVVRKHSVFHWQDTTVYKKKERIFTHEQSGQIYRL